MYKAFIQNIIKFSLYVIVPRPAVRRLVFLLTLSAVVLVNLPEAVAKTCDEAATAPGWLDQPKIAERTDVVIVFIHGILGSAETWCNENGIYWPRLVADDKRFSRA